MLPRSAAARDPRFVALNPRGKIPVLQEGAFALTESAAIVTYLFAAHGAARGFPLPADPRGRALHDSWCFFLLSELDATSLYVVRRHAGLPEICGEAPAAVEAAKAYFLQQAGTVADVLADGRPWLMGDEFGGTDILLASCVAMALPYAVPVPDALLAHRARATARPAHARAAQANRPEHWMAARPADG